MSSDSHRDFEKFFGDVRRGNTDPPTEFGEYVEYGELSDADLLDHARRIEGMVFGIEYHTHLCADAADVGFFDVGSLIRVMADRLAAKGEAPSPTPVKRRDAPKAPPEPDVVWMKALVETHTEWHRGGIVLVEDMEEGEYHPDNNPEIPKFQLEIMADEMSGEIMIVFLNRDHEPLYVWVCHGGVADAVSPKKAAAVLAQEIASNEDSFGYSPECFHPLIRDLVWDELSHYTKSWGDW